MQIVVRGKNVPVPARLKALTEEKLTKLSRLAADVGRVEVDYSEIRNPRVSANQLCEVTVHLKRHFVKAHASATELAAALDLVLDKVSHQVARVKDKRVHRSHPRRRRIGAGAAPLVEDASGLVDEDEAEEDGAALIVKNKQFTIKPMAPEEAALQMDLLGHDFYFFTNAESGQAAVIYRRRDGHLGLIEAVG
ncbi:MAG TPA: ribosome-associated translation inhibitor RaiA [Acidimicrobiia bacterium]|nr:ribosome-associated translation inhibitor RaiA [Acidimicrobiia bacterium]